MSELLLLLLVLLTEWIVARSSSLVGGDGVGGLLSTLLSLHTFLRGLLSLTLLATPLHSLLMRLRSAACLRMQNPAAIFAA